MGLEHITRMSYQEESFNFHAMRNSKSMFDELLQSSWEKCVEKGYFRYKLKDMKTKVLSGKYGLVVQLNIKRALERRKPQHITDVIMPFNSDLFHFGRIDMQEIIFQLCPLHWKLRTKSDNLKASGILEHVVIINVSPLEYCHSLLIPDINKCHPQILTSDGLRLAIETMLISLDPTLRIGFNSLGAFASVNHLHFHLYYLKQNLALENTVVKHLAGECYEMVDFPSEGFVFQLLDIQVEKVVRSVMKLANFLLEKRIAHNIFITRGTSLTDEKHESVDYGEAYNAVRIYVWAREATFGSKNDIAFNPALCELGGHLPIKECKYFDDVTEDKVSTILHEVCHRIFSEIKDDVKSLYEEV